MEIKILDDKDSSLWDAIVDDSPIGTIFHKWEWLRIAEKHSRSRLYPIIGLRGNRPVGVFPLFYLRRWMLKAVFSGGLGGLMPTLGPIIIDYDEIQQHKLEHIYREFQGQVDDFIKSELHPNYIYIITSPGLLDVRPFVWSNYQVSPSYTYKLDLTPGEARVFDTLKSELRNTIRGGGKKGLVVKEGTAADIEYLYRSLEANYKAQNRRLSLPKEYLYDLFQEFGSRNLRLFKALHNGQNAGAILLTTYKDTTSVWVGAAKSKIAGLPTNDTIQWEAIKWSIQNDYRTFELVGAGVERLCEFKSKFSPRLEVYFDIKRSDLLGKLAEKAYYKMQFLSSVTKRRGEKGVK